MPRYAKKYHYRDPVEDEYIFHCLKNFPKERMHLLNPREIGHLKNDAVIRGFINNASHDAKKIIMAKGGFHSVSIYVNENMDPELEKLFNKKFKSVATVQKRELIDHLINKQMFATSSREIIAQAYLIAQNCHNQYYFINQDYDRAKNAIELTKLANLKNFVDTTNTQQLNDAEQGRQTVVAMVLAYKQSENYFRVHMKMTEMEVQLMLFMFYYRDRYVTLSALVKHFYQYGRANIHQRIYRLRRDGYLAGDGKKEKVKAYTIAELGVLTICEYLERLTSNALEI